MFHFQLGYFISRRTAASQPCDTQKNGLCRPHTYSASHLTKLPPTHFTDSLKKSHICTTVEALENTKFAPPCQKAHLLFLFLSIERLCKEKSLQKCSPSLSQANAELALSTCPCVCWAHADLRTHLRKGSSMCRRGTRTQRLLILQA